ncbi:MAG: hypothetical protein K5879_05560 [Lachnospiraceae bacterium]|nr:hypothetical protein [Lachnospiraceae bacterium]
MDTLESVINEIGYQLSITDWNAVGNDFLNDIQTITAGADIEEILDIISHLFIVFFMIASAFSFIALIALAFLAVCLVIAAVFLFIQEYLLPAIALFRMAKNAGYKYPFFAFIPFMQTFLEYVLPKKEFNVFFIRIPGEKRYIAALVSIGLSTVGLATDAVFDFIPVVGGFLSAFTAIAIIVFLIGSKWRKMHDIFRTYDTEKNALLISVIGIFVPLVHTIALLVYMNREPDYGMGNYYK